AAGEVVQVVQEYLPEPGAQLLLGVAGETSEVALGIQKRFLHQVRCAAFGVQLGSQLLFGDHEKVAAARLQRLAKRLSRAGLGSAQHCPACCEGSTMFSTPRPCEMW